MSTQRHDPLPPPFPNAAPGPVEAAPPPTGAQPEVAATASAPRFDLERFLEAWPSLPSAAPPRPSPASARAGLGLERATPHEAPKAAAATAAPAETPPREVPHTPHALADTPLEDLRHAGMVALVDSSALGCTLALASDDADLRDPRADGDHCENRHPREDRQREGSHPPRDREHAERGHHAQPHTYRGAPVYRVHEAVEVSSLGPASLRRVHRLKCALGVSIDRVAARPTARSEVPVAWLEGSDESA